MLHPLPISITDSMNYLTPNSYSCWGSKTILHQLQETNWLKILQSASTICSQSKKKLETLSMDVVVAPYGNYSSPLTKVQKFIADTYTHSTTILT